MTKKEIMAEKGYKTYENDEIMVFWNPKLCVHVAECVKGNPDVFAPARRPWVDVNAAPAKEIAEIIDRCPAQALMYEFK